MQITNASQLTGVFPALFTPLKNDDPKNLRNSIDYKKMGQMIDDVIAAGASGVLPAVTTGQSATVSPQQHLDIIKAQHPATSSRCCSSCACRARRCER